MNPQENQDWERKLQEMETQINRESPPPPAQTEPAQPLTRLFNSSKSIQPLLNQVGDRFNSLSGTSKVIAISAAVLVGFAVLTNVLKLVASLISLGILGAILYLVYKFFVAPKAPK